MKSLVTGAGGMVGSHMVEQLYNRGDEVIGVWHKNKKNVEQVEAPIKFVQCDLRYGQGIDQLIMDNLPDEIYHLAAQSYPTVSWVSPSETIDVNLCGQIAVFEAIKKARRYIKADYDPIVVIACSSAEYGETLNLLGENEVYVKETAQLLPLHPYGVSKVGQDLLGFQYYMNDHIRYGKVHFVRVPAYSPYVVAEHAMALLLTSIRRIHKAYIRTKNFNFSLEGMTGFDLHGKTVGVIGTGKMC